MLFLAWLFARGELPVLIFFFVFPWWFLADRSKNITPAPGHVEIDPRRRQAFVDGRRSRLRSVPEGFAWQHRHQRFVSIGIKGGRLLNVAVPDERAESELLQAAGVDPTRNRVALQFSNEPEPLQKNWVNLVLPLGLLAAVAILFWSGTLRGHGLSFLLAAGISLWLVLLVQRLFGMGTLSAEIGSDGVLLRTRASRRFIGYGAIRNVLVERSSVRLVLADSELIEIDFSLRRPAHHHDPLGAAQSAGLAATFAEWVRMGSDRWRRARELSAAWDAFRRAGRSLDEWRRALRNVTAGGYRAFSVDLETARAILEDPVAPAEVRVGAALALWETGDPELCEQVQNVARACANPALSEALRAVADEGLESQHVEGLGSK
jgi:hypothetical protein